MAHSRENASEHKENKSDFPSKKHDSWIKKWLQKNKVGLRTMEMMMPLLLATGYIGAHDLTREEGEEAYVDKKVTLDDVEQDPAAAIPFAIPATLMSLSLAGAVRMKQAKDERNHEQWSKTTI